MTPQPAERTAPPIVVVAGATAVGKTRVALELCHRFGGEIVGADSIQIYRGFDIGSAKPSAAELGSIPHHLLDVLEPDQPIDAAGYARLADRAIAGIAARGQVPFVVGGTGLWLRALLRGLLELPPVDPCLRAGLEQRWRDGGAAALYARMREVDPRSADTIHASDMLRVVRALEVHAQTGQPLGELRAAHALGKPRHRALMLVLDLPAPAWNDAVTGRVGAMFERGFIAEVEGLLARYGTALKPLRSVGYRQIAEGLARGEPHDQIERRVVRATRIYGRRQRNWFRTDPSVDLRATPTEALAPPLLERVRAHLAQS